MASIALQGKSLTVSWNDLFLSRTVSLALDSLRMVYLFFPEEYKWRPLELENRTQYQCVNLDRLSDEGLLDLLLFLHEPKTALFMKWFTFVLRDFHGNSTQISNKDLTRSKIDLLAQLETDRAARREKLGRWLTESPSVKMGNVILDSEGVRSGEKRRLTWNALGKIEVREDRYVHFLPLDGSGYKRFFARVPPKELRICLAEIDFWRFANLKPSSD